MTTIDEQSRARLIATMELLKRPFDRRQISQLPASAKRPVLDYVSHAQVTARLNDAAPDWTYELEPVVVRGHIERHDGSSRFVADPDGLPHVVAVFGALTIGGVTRQEVGEVDSFTTYGFELKCAISDFIRRAAMRFGVALDLWAKEDLPGAGAHTPPGLRTSSAEGMVSEEISGHGQDLFDHETPPAGDLDDQTLQDLWTASAAAEMSSATVLKAARRLYAQGLLHGTPPATAADVTVREFEALGIRAQSGEMT